MIHSNSEADERHFIRNVVAKQPKYGSVSKNTFREPRYIQHKLQSSDTLQGLALKYNVSVSHFFDNINYIIAVAPISMLITF